MENSSQNVQPHHSDSESNPHTPSPLRVVAPSPNSRPRGRPPGSKNKPKPPVVVTRDSPDALKAHVLEVPAGADVVQRLTNYARQKGRGVCILSGKGTVCNVTLGQVTASGGSVIVTFRGAFEILSLTGTVILPPVPQGLSVSLSAEQGQLLAGNVAGPLIAAGTVVLMAASFASTELERLTSEDHEAEVQENTGGGGQLLQQVQTSQNVTESVYPFPVDGFAWGGSNAAPRPPF